MSIYSEDHQGKLSTRLVEDCRAMARFALAHGIDLPASLLEFISTLPKHSDVVNEKQLPITELNQAHRNLTRIIAPTSPRTILYLEEAADSSLRFLGKIPLSRHLALLFLVLTAMFLALFGLRNQLEAWPQLTIYLFLTNAAGLGAVIAVYYQINRMLSSGSFDPELIVSHWIRVLRGLLGGLVFAVALHYLMIHYEAMFMMDPPLAAMLTAFVMGHICSLTRTQRVMMTRVHPKEINRNLNEECYAMAAFALASGLTIPDSVMEIVEKLPKSNGPMTGGDEHHQTVSAVEMNSAHSALTEIVAPAKPGTILLLEQEASRQSFWLFLGKVPMVRRLMLVSFLFLVMFIGVGLSPDVEPGVGGILESSGIKLLLNLLFYVACAGLGASFAALFQANRYIVAGTFESKYESSYWFRFLLGIIAGLLLSELIPLGADGDSASFGKPTLAMLGGFSAALVYRILNRMVELVETMFSPDGPAVEQARLETKLAMKADMDTIRRNTARHILTAQNMVASDKKPEEISTHLDNTLDSLMPEDK